MRSHPLWHHNRFHGNQFSLIFLKIKSYGLSVASNCLYQNRYIATSQFSATTTCDLFISKQQNCSLMHLIPLKSMRLRIPAIHNLEKEWNVWGNKFWVTNLIVAQCPVTWLAGVSSMREEIYETLVFYVLQ